MKRILFFSLIMVLVLAGCAGPEETPQEPEEVFEFEVKGITIKMHAEAAPILAELGDPTSYFEAESCAFQGMERVYSYSGFELYTYELDGTDYVASIVFLDDSVVTKEGIYLYSTYDEVIAAYGEDYTKTFNLYSYESGDSKLAFLIENDYVTSIEYIAILQ